MDKISTPSFSSRDGGDGRNGAGSTPQNTIATVASVALYPAGDCVSHKPLWAAEAGLLAAGQGAGFEICNSRFGLWLRSVLMGKSNKMCPVCGRKMKCQFIGLQHCKCGMSWKKDVGFFERTSDMVFTLERVKNEKKVKQRPAIRSKQEKPK